MRNKGWGSGAIAGLVVAVLLALPQPAAAQAKAAECKDVLEVNVLVELRSYDDGSTSEHVYVVDPVSGRPVPAGSAAARGVYPAGGIQPLAITREMRWRPGSKVVWNCSTVAAQYSSDANDLMKKYMNGRNGNGDVPLMSIDKKTFTVKGIDKFQNPFDFYEQFSDDDLNNIVMTDDDQFLKDIYGNWQSPNIVSKTVVHGKAQFTMGSDGWYGTTWIEEAEIFWRIDFFQSAKEVYEVIGTSALRFALGYGKTVWSHDIMSDTDHHMNYAAFANAGSTFWIQTSFARDDIYYMDDMSSYPADYLDTARLLPLENEVLDLGGYNLLDIEGKDDEDLHSPTFFLTNIKAYDGKQKMVILVYRIDPADGKEYKVAKLKGLAHAYPGGQAAGKPLYPTIWLNSVKLNRQKDQDKLEKAVEQYGRPQRIDGVEFVQALQIKVKISGYLTKDKKASITRTYWLVDSDEWR